MPKKVPAPFSAGQLESLCQALADTETGLKGSEIGQILRQVGVTDVDPKLTKWKRLYNALAKRQNSDSSADRVLAFVKASLDPVRYRDKQAQFSERRDSVNVALAFYGLEFGEDGKFYKRTKAASLDEAQERANRLRSALSRRGVHPDVLTYCKSEFLQNNSFHAVLEATKSVAQKLRDRTGLNSDGSKLVDEALLGSNPRLKINAFSSESDISEQKGFANLLKGLFGTFRNPTAHAPRIAWNMTEADALDLLTIASYAHRRLDAGTV